MIAGFQSRLIEHEFSSKERERERVREISTYKILQKKERESKNKTIDVRKSFNACVCVASIIATTTVVCVLDSLNCAQSCPLFFSFYIDVYYARERGCAY